MAVDRTTALAVVAGVAGAALLVHRVHRSELEARGGKLLPVLVALRDLPAGSEVSHDAFAVRMTPVRYADDRHVRRSDAERLMGLRLTTSLSAGYALLWTDLISEADQQRALSAIVPPGMRAVTLNDTGNDVESSLLKPGDHVDVLFTATSLPKALAGQRTGGVAGSHATVALLQNALVLAVGGEIALTDGTERRTAGHRGGPVTLAVTATQAQLLTHSVDFGRINLVVRNPDDIEVTDRPAGATFADVASGDRTANPAKIIEKIN